MRRIGHAVLAREPRQRDRVADPQFFEQPRLVRVDGLRAQAQPPRDVFLPQALREQQRHFQFARRQHVERGGIAAIDARQRDALRDPAGEVTLAERDSLHRKQQLGCVVPLADVCRSADFDRAPWQRTIVLRRHDDDARAVTPAHDALGHFQSTDARQVHVAHQHVGPHPAQQRQRLLARGRLPDDIDMRLRTEDQAHPGAYQHVVVEHEHADRHP